MSFFKKSIWFFGRVIIHNIACLNVITDLSKAFDSPPDEFLIAKSNLHGISLKALKLLNSSLNRRFKVKKSIGVTFHEADYFWNTSRFGAKTYFVQVIYLLLWIILTLLYLIDDNAPHKTCDNLDAIFES